MKTFAVIALVVLALGACSQRLIYGSWKCAVARCAVVVGK